MGGAKGSRHSCVLPYCHRGAIMEEEEDPVEDLGVTSPAPEQEEGDVGGEGQRTSSTAQEVEEEIMPPASTSLWGDEEETVLPASTSLDEDGGGGRRETTSLPSSELETSDSAAPQDRGLAETSSSPPMETSEDPSSSSPAPTSPSSWKRRQLVLEEDTVKDASEDKEGIWTDPSSSLEEEPQKKVAKGKALAKKGALNYTVRPVIPAEKAELVSVAKAMHRENFGKNVKELFHLEKEAALKSMQTGLYIGWRCPEYLWDCFRVGDESKCFCGHLLRQHQVYVEKRATVPCTLPGCKCPGFVFIPSRPEEVGEFWLRRRTGFDPEAWRAKCRCKHTHEEHVPTGGRACGAQGCSCPAFTSNFLCAACDRRWEEHETFFESEESRRKGGRPCGEAYLPFAEMPNLCNAVLTGRPDDHSAYRALQQQQGWTPMALAGPSGSCPLPLPPPGPLRRMAEKDDKKA